MATPVKLNIKYMETIAASMLNVMTGVQSLVTDFNIGSVNRTLLEAVAMELEEFYFRLLKGIEAAIPDAALKAFGFARQAATAAVGQVTFSRSAVAPADYLIPAGTLVQTVDGVQFQTGADVTLLTGQTSIIASITARNAGAVGNVSANSITVMTTPIVGIEAVNNAAATTGGTDQESDDARALRFAEFVSALARSPINGVIAGAKTAKLVDPVSGGITEQVKHAKVYEAFRDDPAQPAGIATLYIENGSGVASSNLVAACQKIIDGYLDGAGNPIMGYVAAGVSLTVVACTAQSQNLAMTVTLVSGAVLADVTTALKAAAQSVLDALDIGETLKFSVLLAALVKTAGVADLTLTTPAANVTTTKDKRIILGTVTVTPA